MEKLANAILELKWRDMTYFLNLLGQLEEFEVNDKIKKAELLLEWADEVKGDAQSAEVKQSHVFGF